MTRTEQHAVATAAQPAPASAAQRDGAANDGGRILVVDDDEGVLELVRTLLDRHGYDVVTTRSADEALTLATRHVPELVLLDVVMPEVDGLELARELQQQAGSAAAPVIFLSALHDAESKARGFATGGVDYLTKPFRREELLARVGSHLQLHRVRRQLQAREAELEQLLGNASEEVLASERALSRRTAELAALFAALPDVVFVKDLQGIYIEGNPRFEELLGRPLTELMGRRDEELFPAELAHRLRAQDQATLDADAPMTGEEWVTLPDGTTVLLETITAPVRDGGGEPLGLLGIARDITARHDEQQELRRSRAELLEAQEVAGLGSWQVDMVTGQMTWSQQTFRILGLEPGEIPRRRDVAALVHAEDRDRVLAAWERAQRDGTGEVEHRLARDPQVWVRQRVRFERDAQGALQRALGTMLDITTHTQARFAVEAEQARLEDALAAARAATYEWHVPTDLVHPSQRWCQMLGYDPDRDGPLTVQTWSTWIHPDHAPTVRAALQRLVDAQEEQHEVEFRLQRRDGRWLWVRGLSRVTQRSSEGHALRVSGLIIDITHEKAHQEQLSFVAEHDGLTGLINRQRFSQHLREELLTDRGPQERLAVVGFDLDGFEAVNAAHGRAAGNQLLVEIATRLLRCVGDRHRVARIGGDEFAVAVPVPATDGGWRDAVEELYDAVTHPIRLQGRPLQATASIGVTLYPQARDSDAEQLLRQADQAVYQAKLAGKDRYHLFDTERDAHSRERYQLIDEVHAALSEERFVLHYQPQVNMRTGEVLGFESLIRWQHPERGLLAPGAFIPQLAGHPLSIEIGNWVIEEALGQLARWRDAGLDTTVTVNIDTAQLYDPAFGRRLETQLAAAPGVRPEQLGIEILETGALEDLAHVGELVDHIRALGVTVALDDFGTGYSSLTLLKRLGADVVKIDRSFVMELLEDTEHALIIDSVVSLARNFQRTVLAEGVETDAHGVLLLELGCELAQGFGIARPMPAERAVAWAASWNPPSAWRDVRPLPADRLPGLIAEIEHRVWIRQLRDHLAGHRPDPPGMDPVRCRLGTWLERMTAQTATPCLDALATRHRELHSLASRLVDQRADAGAAAPDAATKDRGLAQLEAASAALVAELAAWRHA